MINALTIDVEDYFHVTAFERYIKRADWDKHPLRVVNNTLGVLDLLDEGGARGTFFVLGWVAERCPGLVREIHRRGHEIACHGYGHERIYQLGPKDFREDVARARMLLEDICGSRIDGYRAPSFSITRRSLWALDIIIEEGFKYDSSIFPIRHDFYGFREAHAYPHEISRPSGTIREFPLSTMEVRLFNRAYKVPVAGGGYLRLLPSWFIKKALKRINESEGQPAVLYFHPWEMDPDQPRIKACFKSRFRHYLNLGKTRGKVRELLGSFDFLPMGQVLRLQPSLPVMDPEATALV